MLCQVSVSAIRYAHQCPPSLSRSPTRRPKSHVCASSQGRLAGCKRLRLRQRFQVGARASGKDPFVRASALHSYNLIRRSGHAKKNDSAHRRRRDLPPRRRSVRPRTILDTGSIPCDANIGAGIAMLFGEFIGALGLAVLVVWASRRWLSE